MRYAKAKGIQLSILTLVHAMKTQHESHNSEGARRSDCVCTVCMYVCFKRYDMSAGSYLEKEKCQKGITHCDPPVVPNNG